MPPHCKILSVSESRLKLSLPSLTYKSSCLSTLGKPSCLLYCQPAYFLQREKLILHIYYNILLKFARLLIGWNCLCSRKCLKTSSYPPSKMPACQWFWSLCRPIYPADPSAPDLMVQLSLWKLICSRANLPWLNLLHVKPDPQSFICSKVKHDHLPDYNNF